MTKRTTAMWIQRHLLFTSLCFTFLSMQFAVIGLELKQRSPIQPLLNISIANGWHGYLPTPEQHRLGGYETWIRRPQDCYWHSA